MPPLDTNVRYPESRRLQEEGANYFHVSTPEYLSKIWDETRAFNITNMAARESEYLKAYGDENSPMMSPEELNKRFVLPGLKFDEYTTESAANFRYNEKRQELFRRQVLSTAEGWGKKALGFGVSLGAMFTDPVNVAAAFIPVVGEGRAVTILGRVINTSRFAKLAMLAKAGQPIVTRTLARGLIGAIDASVGNSLIEAGVYPLARAQQMDYDMHDASVGIMMGAALGSVLHIGSGFMGDILGKMKFSSETRQATLRAAIADVLEGRDPKSAAKIMELDEQAIRIEAANDPEILGKFGDHIDRQTGDIKTRVTEESVPIKELMPVQVDIMNKAEVAPEERVNFISDNGAKLRREAVKVINGEQTIDQAVANIKDPNVPAPQTNAEILPAKFEEVKQALDAKVDELKAKKIQELRTSLMEKPSSERSMVLKEDEAPIREKIGTSEEVAAREQDVNDFIAEHKDALTESDLEKIKDYDDGVKKAKSLKDGIIAGFDCVLGHIV